jgi:hypothetical protein
MKYKIVKDDELIKAKLAEFGIKHLFDDCVIGNGIDKLISFRDYIFFWYQNPLPDEGGFHMAKVNPELHNDFITKIVAIGDGDIVLMMLPENSPFVA